MLELIRGIWVQCPDTRLTQLIMNALRMSEDPYHVEDSILEDKLIVYRDEFFNKE